MRLAFVRHPDGETPIGRRHELPSAQSDVAANAVVINGRFLAQTETGVQRYARQIVQHLDQLLTEQDGKAELVVPRGPFKPIDLRRIDVRLSSLPGGVPWEQLALPSWRGRPTINLCNTAPALARHAIVCIHDCNVYDVPDAYNGAFRTYYRAVLPLLVSRDAKIVTVSRYSAERISMHLGVSLKSIQVLPNGFEHVLSWQPARSALNTILETDSCPFVLLLGSLTKHKNVSLVLGLSQALKALGIRIKVAGATSTIHTSTTFEEDDNVDWLGRVSDDDLALLLDRALCLAFPSKSEGFGLPVLEAMARGCPVVASNRSSIPEVCGDAALMADPDDPAAWVEHFKRLSASKELGRDLAGRGRLRSRLFSWYTSAEGYRQLVARHDA